MLVIYRVYDEANHILIGNYNSLWAACNAIKRHREKFLDAKVHVYEMRR